MERESHRHESFGQISFSRVCGRGVNFYGSELPQDNYITMEVKYSEINRELTQDRYYDFGVPIIKIRLSSGQFAEMITSMNQGSGVPCTIERLSGQKVQDLPIQESRKEFVHRKFDDRMKEFADKIRANQKNAKEIVKKKTLSKQDIFDLWISLNKQILQIIKNQNSVTLKYQLILPNENKADLNFLINDYLGHFEHHLKQLYKK